MHLYDPCFPPWFLFVLDFSGSADGLFVFFLFIIFHWHVGPEQFGRFLPPWFTATESARLTMSSDELRWLISRWPDQDNEPMLALFVGMAASDEEGAADQQEWLALAQHFPKMNIYLAVECAGSDQQMSSICAILHLCRLSRPIFFRPFGGYDINYGNAKMDAQQLAKFITTSAKSKLIVLLNANKYNQIHAVAADGTAGTLWLVDDFVPWCQPRLRLLTELRKLPAEVDGRPPWLNCEAEVTTICRNAGTRSYPHSMLFTPDGARRHSIIGFHSADQLLQFVAEAFNPSVLALNSTLFMERVVVHKPNGQLFFVDFFAMLPPAVDQSFAQFVFANQWQSNDDNSGTAPHRRSGGHRLVPLFTDGVKFWPTAGVLHRFQQRRQQAENLPLVPVFGHSIGYGRGAQSAPKIQKSQAVLPAVIDQSFVHVFFANQWQSSDDNGTAAPPRRSDGHHLVLRSTDGVDFWPTADVVHHRFQQRQQPVNWRPIPVFGSHLLFLLVLYAVLCCPVGCNSLNANEREAALEARIKADLFWFNATLIIGFVGLVFTAANLIIAFAALVVPMVVKIWRLDSDVAKEKETTQRHTFQIERLRKEYEHMQRTLLQFDAKMQKLRTDCDGLLANRDKKMTKAATM